jgi:ribosomal protein L11 methyltransferase
VLAVESDADALDNARDNIARNGAADRVELLHALVDQPFLAAHRKEYHLILANVLSGVLRPLLPGFRDALLTGGHLILSGILLSEADEMAAAARLAGLTLDAEDREEEWWSVRLRA